MPLPPLTSIQLTHGQVAWALCAGRTPDAQTLDALRYLRQLGVPFAEDERGLGRGNRLTYNFDNLMECATAMYAIRRGQKPGDAASFLVANRESQRQRCREAYLSTPKDAVDQTWCKSRGREGAVVDDEQFIRLHDRFNESLASVEPMSIDEAVTFRAGPFDLVERFNDRVRILVPLRRVLLETMAWALEAPVISPGRRATKSKPKSLTDHPTKPQP